MLRHFFRDRRGGFFVDVGAARPTVNSTTYYLEKHLGWTGIGIDALPEYAEQLLDREGVDRIDFLSMDIEESEPAALAGFDIERFRPALVCVEATPSIRAQLRAYFEAHGYERIDAYRAHDRVNWYFKPKE